MYLYWNWSESRLVSETDFHNNIQQAIVKLRHYFFFLSVLSRLLLAQVLRGHWVREDILVHIIIGAVVINHTCGSFLHDKQ